ncbi:MAG: Ig-like domain-containing protein [Candidatus Saganbacteria bacterium]|nr:Ig-like domain-containing protein [Candidatus Saganbacteria bacterium]
MRKGFVLSVGLLFVVVIAMLSGCNQSVPQVGSASPQNLVCKGIVYGRHDIPYGSSSFDWQNIGPVAGATVTLVGSYETKTAMTNAIGEYVFENVKNGQYEITASKEGYQVDYEYLLTDSLFFFSNASAASAKASDIKAAAVPDETIFTVNLYMYANPVMRSVTPTPSSTIETTASFVITFNKAMDTSTVRPMIISNGLRLSGVGDTVNATSTWSSGDKVLTISPINPLLPNQEYLVYLAADFSKVKDKEGNLLASATSTSYGVVVHEDGDVVENNDYFTYRTATGGAPTAPTGLSIVVDGKPLSSEAGVGPDFSDIIGTTTTIGLSWVGSSGNLTGYKVYVSDSLSNNYRLLEQVSAPSFYTPLTVFNTNMGEVLNTLYGTSYIDPLGTGNYPMINRRTYFKVVAFNGEYESASVETSAIDLVGPRVCAEAQSGRTGGGGVAAAVLANNYYLPALVDGTDARVCYIAFREPLDPSTVIDTNFTYSGGNVTAVDLLTRATADLDPAALWTGNALTIVKITVDADLAAGQTITVGTGVKDLPGNSASGTGTATVQ